MNYEQARLKCNSVWHTDIGLACEKPKGHDGDHSFQGMSWNGTVDWEAKLIPPGVSLSGPQQPLNHNRMLHSGLAKLAEEIGELGQIVGKMLQYPELQCDDESEHPSGYNLRREMEKEMADVLAAIKFTRNHLDLDLDFINMRRESKYLLFSEWEKGNDDVQRRNIAGGLQTQFAVSKQDTELARPEQGGTDSAGHNESGTGGAVSHSEATRKDVP